MFTILELTVKLCLQVCVQSATPRETEISLRTLASSTSPRQQASPEQPNLPGRAPPHLPSPALLFPPLSARPLSPALLPPPPSAHHLTPALPLHPPSARLHSLALTRLPPSAHPPSSADLPPHHGAGPQSLMSSPCLTKTKVVLTRSS